MVKVSIVADLILDLTDFQEICPLEETSIELRRSETSAVVLTLEQPGMRDCEIDTLSACYCENDNQHRSGRAAAEIVSIGHQVRPKSEQGLNVLRHCIAGTRSGELGFCGLAERIEIISAINARVHEAEIV
jgi:hypothetical protein